MIVFERRACAILYNVWHSRNDPRPFLVPANVCPIVPETLRLSAQPFELIDIAAPSLDIDWDACVERLRTRPDGYAGMIFVRPYGSERDPTESFGRLKEIQPNLLLIDDKCLCRPDCDGERISRLADVTLFSTGYAKYTDVGGGGFAFLSDPVAYRRDGQAGAEWLDLRPPETSWDVHRDLTIGATRASDERKKALNDIYTQTLPPEIQFDCPFQGWRFNIRVPAADELIRSVFEAGLFASRHYRSLGTPGGFPNAERLQGEVVNLFNDRYFDESRAHRVAEIVVQHMS